MQACQCTGKNPRRCAVSAQIMTNRGEPVVQYGGKTAAAVSIEIAGLCMLKRAMGADTPPRRPQPEETGLRSRCGLLCSSR